MYTQKDQLNKQKKIKYAIAKSTWKKKGPEERPYGRRILEINITNLEYTN